MVRYGKCYLRAIPLRAYIGVSSFRTALLSACTPFNGVHEVEHQEPSPVLHSNSIEAPTGTRCRSVTFVTPKEVSRCTSERDPKAAPGVR